MLPLTRRLAEATALALSLRQTAMNLETVNETS